MSPARPTLALAFLLAACGGSAPDDGGPSPADTIARTAPDPGAAPASAVEVALVDSIPWEDMLGGSGVLHRVVVRRAGRVDTLAGVTTDRGPIVRGDSVVLGLDVEEGRTVRGFRHDLASGETAGIDLPPDFAGFLAHALAPDGEHLAYVAKEDGTLAAVVRQWPTGGEVYRSHSVQGYPSDAMNSRVRWSGPERVEMRIRLDGLDDPSERWLRIRGSPTAGSMVADTVSGPGD